MLTSWIEWNDYVGHPYLDHFGIAFNSPLPPPLPRKIWAKADNEIVWNFLTLTVQKNTLTF